MDSGIPSASVDQALTLICTTTVAGSLYTLTLVLYCLYARLSYSQLKIPDGRLQKLWAFFWASTMIICGTMNVALNSQYARMIFVDYSTLPGGPLGPLAQKHASTVQQINNVVTLIVEILALGVLLWRVWVIYSGARLAVLAVVVAMVFYLALVVSKILHLVFGWDPLPGSLPNVSRTSDIMNIMAEAFTPACKIIMTFMIITRLMFFRRKHIKSMGNTDIAAQYWGIAAMLIESYALVTAWNVGYLIGYILKNSAANHFFSSGAVQIETLSYLLIWYRVFSGRAWDKQTQNQLSTWRCDDNIQPSDDDSSTGVVGLRGGSKEKKDTSTLSSRTNV